MKDTHKAWQGALYKDVLGMNLLNQAWQHFSTQSGGSLSALENRLASLVGQGVYSISQLADHLNMSERSLQRHSKEVLKQPLGKWINEQRLNKSKRLLEEQSSSLSEVAWQVGYKQVSSFIHAFQRQFGITPKAYVVQYRVNH